MTSRSTISYISSLLDNPHNIVDGDKGSIGSFVQTYPYFIPVRYLTALDAHKKAAFSPGMLTSVEPYLGNWILFCDFLDAGINGPNIANSRKWPVTEVPVEEPISSVVEERPLTVEPETEESPVEIPDHAEPVFTEAVLVEEFVFNKDTVFEDAVSAEIAVDTEPAEDVPVVAESFTAEPLVPIETSTDYFRQQGEIVPEEIPADIEELMVTVAEPTIADEPADDRDKTLMVMMSFSEWLVHFRNTAERRDEETKDQKALRTMWQKEKLAAALEEENDEIPENVFEMAVNSISTEDGLASETLADLYIKQGKYDKAIEMYRKLSLRNPQKNAYFARKIEEVLKDKQS